jgi:transposase InsO family protein
VRHAAQLDRLLEQGEDPGLLADARDDLVHAQTRARNRLHAHLVVLLPGYGRTVAQLVSGRQLAAIERALDDQAGVRAELARALLAEIRDLGRRAAELERSLAALVAGHPVLGLPWVGVLTAARLVAEVGEIRRFRSPAACAMLAGVAPIPASSRETQRMRLNRGGNRRLNRALYTIALSQAWHHEPAKAYAAPPESERPTPLEARHVVVDHSGELVGFDCFHVGRLAGTIGRVWQYTAIDLATSHVWAELATTPLNPSAKKTSALARRVAADLRSHGWRLELVLTDNGSEFRSGVFGETVRQLGARQTFIRAGRPATNGAVDRVQRTILEECWRPSFARSLVPKLTGLTRDQAAYLRFYNEERAHTGRLTQGRTRTRPSSGRARGGRGDRDVSLHLGGCST